jgi:anti-sigma factor RsiW
MDEHETTRENLTALAAGLLPDTGAKAARQHLFACAACRRELESCRRMLQNLADLPAAGPSPFRLARVTALAVARREELLAKRRNAVVLAGLAMISWLFFLASLPLLSALSHWLGAWLGISPLPALILGIALWWGSNFFIGLSLVPLLHEHETEWEEKRR